MQIIPLHEIIRESTRIYIHSFQRKRLLPPYISFYVPLFLPDDGRRDRPKHVMQLNIIQSTMLCYSENRLDTGAKRDQTDAAALQIT